MILPQSTISRIIFRVTIILASYLNTYVKFPTNQAVQENKRLFKELGYGHGAIGLSIDGAIDFTHIRLFNNNFQGLDEMYRNRKGYFSLNVQVKK